MLDEQSNGRLEAEDLEVVAPAIRDFTRRCGIVPCPDLDDPSSDPYEGRGHLESVNTSSVWGLLTGPFVWVEGTVVIPIGTDEVAENI